MENTSSIESTDTLCDGLTGMTSILVAEILFGINAIGKSNKTSTVNSVGQNILYFTFNLYSMAEDKVISRLILSHTDGLQSIYSIK